MGSTAMAYWWLLHEAVLKISETNVDVDKPMDLSINLSGFYYVPATYKKESATILRNLMIY